VVARGIEVRLENLDNIEILRPGRSPD